MIFTRKGKPRRPVAGIRARIGPGRTGGKAPREGQETHRMTEAEIRAAHPDWTDEQVQAELAGQPPPVQPPAPGTGEAEQAERDAAYARLRRTAEDAEKRAKAAEDKLAEEARKKAEEEGRFKELAESEKARADALEAKQTQDEQRRNAERSARDMKFKDGDYALYLLAQQGVDFAEPQKVREGLEALAKDRSELVTGAAPPPSGGPAGGAKGEPPGLTAEQIAAMTPRQLAAIDPEVIKKALGQQQ